MKKETNDYVNVIIPRPLNLNGDTDTVVSLNGKNYQIQFDRIVSVPRGVAEIIQSSETLKAKIAAEEQDAIYRDGKKPYAEF